MPADPTHVTATYVAIQNIERFRGLADKATIAAEKARLLSMMVEQETKLAELRRDGGKVE
jgi:hypothetical protein